MALNAEEKHAHETFKRKQYARLTEEQVEIAQLKQQLERAQNEVRYQRSRLTYYVENVDKLFDQRARIKEAIESHNTGERSAGITLDTIKAVFKK